MQPKGDVNKEFLVEDKLNPFFSHQKLTKAFKINTQSKVLLHSPNQKV